MSLAWCDRILYLAYCTRYADETGSAERVACSLFADTISSKRSRPTDSKDHSDRAVRARHRNLSERSNRTPSQTRHTFLELTTHEDTTRSAEVQEDTHDREHSSNPVDTKPELCTPVTHRQTSAKADPARGASRAVSQRGLIGPARAAEHSTVSPLLPRDPGLFPPTPPASAQPPPSRFTSPTPALAFTSSSSSLHRAASADESVARETSPAASRAVQLEIEQARLRILEVEYATVRYRAGAAKQDWERIEARSEGLRADWQAALEKVRRLERERENESQGS